MSKKLPRISISNWIKIFFLLLPERIIGLEERLFRFQWYRKRKGGAWNLLCMKKEFHWYPVNDFVPMMAGFGVIVDVIKTENWS